MGHLLDSNHTLVPLIDRLNKYPIGVVDSEKLRELLSLLFSEEEAFVASKFPLTETTLKELSTATKMAEEDLLPVLESMADKGIIMDLPYNGKAFYLLMPGTIGFFEFTFMKNRTDLPLEKVAKLMDEYFTDREKGHAQEFFGSKTPLTRSLPYQEHIPVTSVITDYESARNIIKNAKFGAVSMCYCRHQKEHAGGTCKKGAPVEGICISLGTGATFLARRGFAEEKSKDELLKIIDTAHQLNLTHITDNVRNKPTFICNCCGCCCHIMEGIQAGYINGVGKTNYLATIDPELCDYCGECFTACNPHAIGLDKSGDYKNRADKKSKVDTEICLGCGACISSCKHGAISLIPRETPPKLIERKRDLFKTILREKGRLRPFIIEGIKKKVMGLFLRH